MGLFSDTNVRVFIRDIKSCLFFYNLISFWNPSLFSDWSTPLVRPQRDGPCHNHGKVQSLTCAISSKSTLYTTQMHFLVGWLVGCCLASHSAIFQLYSDGTVVKVPNFVLLPGTQRHGQLGVFSVPGRTKMSFTSLSSDCPDAVRVSRESSPDRPIHNPVRYLFAIATGNAFLKHMQETQTKHLTLKCNGQYKM